MTQRYARSERNALADSLLAAGPAAPTLCEGWLTKDLAAHLVLRERRLDAAPGIMLKPLRGHLQKVQDKLAAGPYPALVERFRTPPPLNRIGPLDEAMNLSEYFVHHEDVRRAAPGWTPRALEPGYEDALRARVKMTVRLGGRNFPARLVVHCPGLEPVPTGRGGPDAEVVELTGAPGELLLFFMGRQRAAEVNVQGSDVLADRLKQAHLGM
jgi:uncharacterized protein (TIGR03085 family)